MNDLVRVRIHTDGRLAVLRGEPTWYGWCVFDHLNETVWEEERKVSGPGWSELFVAELPEPDDEDAADDTQPETLSWYLKSGTEYTASREGLDIDGGRYDPDPGRPYRDIRTDALKMMAAVEACERYRAER